MKRCARLIGGVVASAVTVTPVWLPAAAHAGITASELD